MRACCKEPATSETNVDQVSEEELSASRENDDNEDEEMEVSFGEEMVLDEESELEEDPEFDSDCEEESDKDEGKDADESYVTAIPVDWSPADSPHNKDYKTGLLQVADCIAGQLGGNLPELVSHSRSDRVQKMQDWLPLSLKKKCAPASPFLVKLVTKCDEIFRELNKNTISKEKGILAR